MGSRIKRFLNKSIRNGGESSGSRIRSETKPTVSEQNQAKLEDEYGIKVLYSPNQPRADIIFVHGLTGSQLSTWTAPGATAAWPRLLLPEDIPDARISAFGYDADVLNVLGSAGQNRVRHHARNLLRGIADMWLETGVVGLTIAGRYTADLSQRGLPILFIVHSLGGLVCENALGLANNAEQYEKRILECTQAIAFLGTPHRGSDAASLATIAGNIVNVVKNANTNILGVLKPSSEVLENLTQDFHTMLRSREQARHPSIKITCFIEELPVSKAGKTIMVVPSRSATLDQYPSVTIHADHMNMTKFKDRTNDYKRIMLQLRRWMEELALTENTVDKTPGSAKFDLNTGNLIGLNVPKKNVSYFVTRLGISQDLDECLWTRTEATSVVLLGMGGSGKTQLALECCQRAEADSSFTAVIWIDASSPATVAQSYSTIASKIYSGCQTISDVDESITTVERALQQQKGKWFIVFDNFDNPKDFKEHVIQYYIPKAANGRVIFTSRHASSERLGHVIRVSGMSGDESLNLLLHRPTSNMTERQQGLEIAAMLGYLALALDQAGAYIRARCLPLEDFVPHYQRRKKKILEEVPEQWEYRRKFGATEPESVLSAFVTWELSFAQICGDKEARDRKEHFLTLAAHLDNKCISQRYFRVYCTSERAEWVQVFMTDGDWDKDIYQDLLAECSKLSLLQILDRRAGGAQFSLHPVVRDWIRVRKERDKQISYAKECTELLTYYVKGVRFTELNLQVKQETLQHIDACMQNEREILDNPCGSVLAHQTHSADLFALCYVSSGRYSAAEELYKRTLMSKEEKLGPDHLDTLTTMMRLAGLYSKKGQYDNAEVLCKRTLAGKEEKLGPDHPDTLITVQNLAIVYRKQRRYDDAEELCERVLTSREEKLGPDHPYTLRTVENLASIYRVQGRYDDAEKLCKRVFQDREEKLGPDHPDTLITVQDLASTYDDKGQCDQAEKLHQRALTGREEILGPDHPDTLKSVHNLAIAYCKMGRLDQAEKLCQRALTGREEKLGPDHPATLNTVANFADCLEQLGRVGDADLLLARFGIRRLEGAENGAHR